MPAKLTTSFADRFWSKVNKDGPVVRPDLGSCWLWTAGLNEYGYGQFSWRDDSGKQHCFRANRVAWEIANGQTIPDGQWVLHECDVKACVNPVHLHLGDRPQNITEAMARQRIASGERHWAKRQPELTPRGEQHYKAILTAEQVREIRARYAQGGISHQHLGTEYGVTRKAIGEIINRHNWRHV